MKQKWISLLLVLVMIFQIAGCTPAPSPSSPDAPSTQPDSQQDKQTDALPAVGDVISGFTLERIDPYPPLNADILSFRHPVSGAQLCYIKNDDTNRAFSIAYRTPHVDEADVNHVFEHAVIASSEKYPSNNLFFDLVGKTYNTYCNAFTYLPFTMYPVASQSEEQLLKMADAYLSCMVDPGILKDERFFQREALRYMLYDVEDPITMGGTVFSEDMGYMTAIGQESLSNILKALYPGEYASNMNGRAFLNYKDLTYEHMKATYDRAYHFDNSLLLLYGDLDYRSFLEFLDSEYLSKAGDSQTDLSAYEDPKTAPGFVEKVAYSPAYEGDATEDVSIISYVMDLDGQSWETIYQYEFLAALLSNESSVFHENLKSAGLISSAYAAMDYFEEKPFFLLEMTNANPEDAAAFKAVVEKTLDDVAQNGLDSSLVESFLNTKELGDYLTLENASSVVDSIFPMITVKWVQTGETDLLACREAAFEALCADKNQTLIRRLASDLRGAERSAMVTTVPKPGLAEEIIGQQEEYLAQLKASMTAEELEQLVADTLAFDEWNTSGLSNSEISIPVQSLPDPQQPAAFTKETVDGATYYTSAVQLEKVGAHCVMLDTSAVAQEDLHYIPLYATLMQTLATQKHSRAELDVLMNQYLYGLDIDVAYPDAQAGTNSHPILYLSWYGRSEDYETSLNLLLELLETLQLDDGEEIRNTLDKYLPSMNWVRRDALDLGFLIAEAGKNGNEQYKEYLTGQRYYEFAAELRRRLDDQPGAMDALIGKLQSVAEQILRRDRMIVINAAAQEDLARISASSKEILGALPSLPVVEADYDLPQYPARTAVIVEASDHYTVASSDTAKADGLSGTFFPFISAISDRYIVPQIRFQGLAYSAAKSFSTKLDYIYTYTYSDPNVSETIAVIDGETDVLAAMELTQEELDSYILSAYSTVTNPMGPLTRAVTAINWDITGFDPQRWYQLACEIKTATVEDQAGAAEMLRSLQADQRLVTVGNAEKLRAEAEQFDQVLDYREQAGQQP